MKTVIVKIIGGLGNQMFQYAVARRAAILNNCDLKLDISAFTTYRRPYFLNRFNIIEQTIAGEELRPYDKLTRRLTLPWLINKLKAMDKKVYRREEYKQYFKYQPAIFKMENFDKIILDGYWQNEKYFLEIRDILLKEFSLKPENEITSTELMDKITHSNSVAIHFRRGDNVAKKIYGVPSLEYYQEAIDLIAQKSGAPQLFIFSDEISWVEENFKPAYPTTYVSANLGLKDYQELIAMSKCKHNIIANSTFSWWSAWLNANPEKLVVAPKKFFADAPYDTSELYPPSWIQL